MDKVWYNIVKDIEGSVWNDALSIEENLAIHEKQRKLEKQITKTGKTSKNRGTTEKEV